VERRVVIGVVVVRGLRVVTVREVAGEEEKVRE
jgi:hypothetical protein